LPEGKEFALQQLDGHAEQTIARLADASVREADGVQQLSHHVLFSAKDQNLVPLLDELAEHVLELVNLGRMGELDKQPHLRGLPLPGSC
jgi:hypothetical protein